MRSATIDIEGDMDTLMKELREREERGEPAPTSYDVGRNGYTPVGGRHTRKTARPGKSVCGCQIVLAVLLVLACLSVQVHGEFDMGPRHGVPRAAPCHGHGPAGVAAPRARGYR